MEVIPNEPPQIAQEKDLVDCVVLMDTQRQRSIPPSNTCGVCLRPYGMGGKGLWLFRCEDGAGAHPALFLGPPKKIGVFLGVYGVDL